MSSALFLVRSLLTTAGALLGFWLASILLERGVLTGPNNLLYLTALGLLIGYLLGGPLTHLFKQGWQTLADTITDIPPSVVLAAGTGATVALLVTVLLNNLLAAVPGFTWYWSLLIAVVLIAFSSWFFVTNRTLFNFLRSESTDDLDLPAVVGGHRPRPKVIDTSAIIDGRIVDVIEANFLVSKIVIPQFVLGELQHIADSDDPLRRTRGRRGLEMLDRLVGQRNVQTQVVSDNPDAGTIDDKLVRLCQGRNADLITTDYNLNRVAALQGVTVLNVNQLANAVKAMFLPGERLSLNIVKKGREPGQGLAYLEDGTMVVVEDAADMVGTTVDTVVTSNLQTNMGRMIFARPDPAN